MLKKSLVSPAQPWRAETRLFPYVVLASLRPSTYPHQGKELFRQLGVGRVRKLRLGPSLAAALLNGLFEHPAGVGSSCPRGAAIEALLCRKGFSAVC